MTVPQSVTDVLRVVVFAKANADGRKCGYLQGHLVNTVRQSVEVGFV